MDALNIQVIQATPDQKPILARLLELYAYDFSDTLNFDLNEDGLFDYDRLPLYWTDPNRYPFLIRVNGKLGGVVLIQKGSPISHDPDVWDVSEFFVVRKYRQKGVGQTVAHTLWKRFPGRWQVRVLEKNLTGKAFWESSIRKLAGGHSSSSFQRKIDGASWLIFNFSSSSPGPI